MWIPSFVGDIIVPTPKDHVSPNKGVRMITHLAMTASVCLSSVWTDSPTPLLSILTMMTIKIKILIRTMVKAGITNASRAFVSNQLSQHASFF